MDSNKHFWLAHFMCALLPSVCCHSVPDGLEASAAAELIRDGVSSIVGGVRGLRRLTLTLRCGKAVRGAIALLLPDGTEVGDNFTTTTSHRTVFIRLDVTRRS
mmetsp:Transcript_19493/g.55877  ORF Transcript_19493/g.55877 Transcript_19493/m.55877 type:complete len:103 (-) Transcript_19493:9-317(-)